MLVADNGIFNLGLFGSWNLYIVQFCGLENVFVNRTQVRGS